MIKVRDIVVTEYDCRDMSACWDGDDYEEARAMFKSDSATIAQILASPSSPDDDRCDKRRFIGIYDKIWLVVEFMPRDMRGTLLAKAHARLQKLVKELNIVLKLTMSDTEATMHRKMIIEKMLKVPPLDGTASVCKFYLTEFTSAYSCCQKLTEQWTINSLRDEARAQLADIQELIDNE